MEVTKARMALAKAIDDILRDMGDALYEISDDALSPKERANMREGIGLLSVLVNVARGKEFLYSMGAPGDWGYGTSLGDNLLATLRAEPLCKA